MEIIIWLITLIPCSLLFTGIGIYAWRREKPMWFWSGSTVREEEITDVKAYNRENGIMWICYSLVFWISTIMGLWEISTAGLVLAGFQKECYAGAGDPGYMLPSIPSGFRQGWRPV